MFAGRNEYILDMNGLVQVPWEASQKLPVLSLLRRIPSSWVLCLHGVFDGHPEEMQLKIQKSYFNEGSFKTLHYPFFDEPEDKLNDQYLCFMGMCVMKISQNHLVTFNDLICVPATKINSKLFFIVNIFDQSPLADSEILVWATKSKLFSSMESLSMSVNDVKT